MRMKTTYQDFWHRLARIYDEGEAKAIARTVYETRYGLSLADLCMGRDEQIAHEEELQQLLERLEQQEPVQYVLGEARFCNRTFHVEPGVLIPRPETEELCRLVSTVCRPPLTAPSILDIGTGSGCIAITLALDIPDCRVTAWDISPVALRVAGDNARQLGASVTFREVDMLSVPYYPPFGGFGGGFDVIVSNPPYICDSEADEMAANVLEYEPEIALFVPDDDPLRFYRPIMNYAQSALQPDGWLFLEVNPLYEEWIEEHLLELGFAEVRSHDDQYGKTRFISAQR